MDGDTLKIAMQVASMLVVALVFPLVGIVWSMLNAKITSQGGAIESLRKDKAEAQELNTQRENIKNIFEDIGAMNKQIASMEANVSHEMTQMTRMETKLDQIAERIAKIQSPSSRRRSN